MVEQAAVMTQKSECNNLQIYYHLKAQVYPKTAIEA
jgi:hypothetical protein